MTISGVAQTDPASRDPFETEHSFSKSVIHDLDARSFKDLDARAADIRKRRAMFDSGAWKLWWFVDAFNIREPALHGVEPQSVETLIHEWIATTGSVTSRVALAQFHLGFADSLPRNAWQDHEKHVAAATQILDSLQEEGRCDIDCLYLQICAHNLGGWSDPLRKVLKTEPGYWHAFSLATYFLAPRWGGSTREIEKFAAEAADATRTTMGESVYMKATAMALSTCACEPTYDWKRLRKGFEEFQSRFPSSRVNFYSFARLAFEAHDREMFRRLIANPFIESWQFQEERKWAMEPDPPVSSRSTNLARVALTELTTSGHTEHPILFYYESGGKTFGASVAPSTIDQWTWNRRQVTSSVRVPLEQSATPSIVFDAEGETALSPFHIRSVEPIILELVTAITCRVFENACVPVRFQARIVGQNNENLTLRVLEPPGFDQAIGAPIIDDRESLLGIVHSVTRNEDGSLELSAEPIHFVLGVNRTQTPIGAK
ncbi:MAG TPA: hypothetical protein VNN25_23095 [Thermoanaerobaculia bacterium]|nr:hypothetical protein [Thermoanaerobaculia bacterium]